MKKRISMLLFVLVTMLAMTLSVSAADADLVIRSAADLQAFAAQVDGGDNFAGKVVKLGANIDLSGIEWQPIGGDSIYFAGEFDGQGYTISNLTNTQNIARKGLFGLVEKAYIHDLTLKNVTFTNIASNARVGAVAANLQYWNVVEKVVIDGITIEIDGNDGLVGTVAGYVWKSQLGNVDVKNASITANGTGNCIGGHTGYGRGHVWDTGVIGNNANWLEDGVQTINGTEYVMQNYFVDCDVNGITINLNGTGNEAGGFFGSDTYNSHSNYFVNSHVKGLTVNCAAGTSQTVGGFIAWNNGTTEAGTFKGFDGCSAQGVINGANGTYGGFAGQVGGRACGYENATADVDITSTGTAGGFVGITQQYFTHLLTFTNCHATGDVTGTGSVGGFAGKIALGGDGDQINVKLTACTASGNVTGGIAGGLVGEINTDLPATNWSTVEGTGTLPITDCEMTGTVKGTTYAAGLIGLIDVTLETEYKPDTKLCVTFQGNTPAANYSASVTDPIYNLVGQFAEIEFIHIYTVKVEDGQGGGKYASGTPVTLTAETQSGNTFAAWEVVSGVLTLSDPTSSTITFTMPQSNVTLKATYTSYSVIVANGIGSGTYTVGTPVAITANAPASGYTFAGWTVVGADLTLPKTMTVTFTMPSANVTVTANYTKNFDFTSIPLSVLTASASDGGKISFAGSRYVVYGKQMTYTMTPDEGYELTALLVNGQPVEVTDNTYTFRARGRSFVIEAIFSQILPDTADEALLAVDESNAADPVTRAEIIDILWTLAGAPVVESTVDFFDVAADAPNAAAVAWAGATGITAGNGENLFAGEDTLTRAELIDTLYAYAAPEGDADAAAWAASLELIAAGADLTVAVTREEASAWLEAVRG